MIDVNRCKRINRGTYEPPVRGGGEVRKISDALVVGMSPGRPPHWEIFFW